MKLRSLASSDKYFLMLAIAPAWWLITDLLLYRLGGDDALAASDVTTVIAMVVLVLLDSGALARQGIRVSPWWGILFPPLYLVVRTRRAGSTWALPVTWLLLFVAYVIVSEAALEAAARPL